MVPLHPYTYYCGRTVVIFASYYEAPYLYSCLRSASPKDETTMKTKYNLLVLLVLLVIILTGCNTPYYEDRWAPRAGTTTPFYTASAVCNAEANAQAEQVALQTLQILSNQPRREASDHPFGLLAQGIQDGITDTNINIEVRNARIRTYNSVINSCLQIAGFRTVRECVSNCDNQ